MYHTRYDPTQIYKNLYMTHNTKEVVKKFKKKKKIAIKRNNTINLNLTEQLGFRDIEIESSNFSILI